MAQAPGVSDFLSRRARRRACIELSLRSSPRKRYPYSLSGRFKGAAGAAFSLSPRCSVVMGLRFRGDDVGCVARVRSTNRSSWPGLSRPSTSSFRTFGKGVDHRGKPGDDDHWCCTCLCFTGFRFIFQTATCDCSRAWREVSFGRVPHMRGVARRKAQRWCFASLAKEAHRLTARHQRRFWARGALFRDRTDAFTPRSGGFRRVRACPRPAIEGRAT
ncbi:hypothetical protein HMPREF9696_00094 [Afipia clevelandensis ATCC 49720]|uniref:Uncharacterized protein n=1 Tax=Afipia clevelandensis ATCC 49720 TaxID=883079 RepID=K8PLT5_9BRAD|nr:hypothetical protein HMPREF9696_00094 [Afipia clevelandensis ATCC 49720]